MGRLDLERKGDSSISSTADLYKPNSPADRSKPIGTKTSDYTILASDYTILADATANTVTISLPASPSAGQIFCIKCVNDTFAVTVDRNGKNIDGDASDMTLIEDESILVQYDGASWRIL